MNNMHIPVLLDEAIKGLNISEDGVYIDMTAGYFGHSGKIAEELSSNGTLLCLDKDEAAISYMKKKMKEVQNKRVGLNSFPKLIIKKTDFRALKKIAKEAAIEKADGILFDLGVSSMQIDDANRGFSYINDGKLDMRMDKEKDFSAYELINEYDEESLINCFSEYGEESFSKTIAKNIIKKRSIKKIESTRELFEIIEGAVPRKFKKKGFKNVKKIFQALRIEVNDELNALKESLEAATSLLNKKGRLVVISFHSLEDKIVKNFFVEKENPCTCPKDIPYCICGAKPVLKRVNRKPIMAVGNEIRKNSRAKSAKLRIAEKR
ncbi:MAG: 16S rRNA (cytosine(1402)-N(4))-methyltransferase RsmH [Clostridiales Family XIII bacterium]|jgi:16S rRNA (cytosine1402-N4)-methyltransferase|nr:16S rRNA (cytosine(1402)-N(4))-methyltransferase RsmH [Clostridiales Family XIII bacterium]